MAKRDADGQRPKERPNEQHRMDSLGLATLAGVVAVLVLSFANWRDVDRIDQSLNDRLGKMETRLAQVSEKMDKLPAQAAPRQGPDPSRVYAINTGSAPFRGPENAPITVAEFSDFQ